MQESSQASTAEPSSPEFSLRRPRETVTERVAEHEGSSVFRRYVTRPVLPVLPRPLPIRSVAASVVAQSPPMTKTPNSGKTLSAVLDDAASLFAAAANDLRAQFTEATDDLRAVFKSAVESLNAENVQQRQLITELIEASNRLVQTPIPYAIAPVLQRHSQTTAFPPSPLTLSSAPKLDSQLSTVSVPPFVRSTLVPQTAPAHDPDSVLQVTSPMTSHHKPSAPSPTIQYSPVVSFPPPIVPPSRPLPSHKPLILDSDSLFTLPLSQASKPKTIHQDPSIPREIALPSTSCIPAPLPPPTSSLKPSVLAEPSQPASIPLSVKQELILEDMHEFEVKQECVNATSMELETEEDARAASIARMFAERSIGTTSKALKRGGGNVGVRSAANIRKVGRGGGGVAAKVGESKTEIQNASLAASTSIALGGRKRKAPVQVIEISSGTEVEENSGGSSFDINGPKKGKKTGAANKKKKGANVEAVEKVAAKRTRR
ncbi:hypothetical protein BCR33DRAFT_847285 [Rhizoclosmatium globosum]|uniref:Uncharacterized protein n=1 Tax=Rhizoclosmatium globosum TaxID=329046 RepID=A0A1Y2CT93_9FUNG|nr:hypothetical protein BCR33DRAFT_847285 [Rhizoclosmatium globosum]|eukprot:ORY50064.1 hypothetical protein BCR33DRAFT_847285 [Rhizoclosmatium globosum]